MNKYELMAQYDNAKSFGHKAMVEIDEQNNKTLFSYNTKVATISQGIVKVLNVQSNTTVKHIREFLLQNGFNAETKKQIIKDYM